MSAGVRLGALARTRLGGVPGRVAAWAPRLPGRAAALTPPSRPGPGAALCAAFLGAFAVSFGATTGEGDPAARAPVGSLAVPLEPAAAGGDLRLASSTRDALASSPRHAGVQPADGLVLGEAAPIPPLARKPEPPAPPVVSAPAPRVDTRDPEPRPPQPAPPAQVAPESYSPPAPQSYSPPAPPPARVTPPPVSNVPSPDPAPAPRPAPAPDPSPVEFDDSG
jgi:hypothetical protein